MVYEWKVWTGNRRRVVETGELFRSGDQTVPVRCVVYK